MTNLSNEEDLILKEIYSHSAEYADPNHVDRKGLSVSDNILVRVFGFSTDKKMKNLSNFNSTKKKVDDALDSLKQKGLIMETKQLGVKITSEGKKLV